MMIQLDIKPCNNQNGYFPSEEETKMLQNENIEIPENSIRTKVIDIPELFPSKVDGKEFIRNFFPNRK